MSGSNNTKENEVGLASSSQVSGKVLAELPEAGNFDSGQNPQSAEVHSNNPLKVLQDELNKANHYVIEAQKGPLDSKERSFLEGLQENLIGAAAWIGSLDNKRFKYTAKALMSLSLAAQMLLSCVPLPVIVPPIEVQGNTSTPTLVVPTSTETASPTPTETAIPEAKFKENPNIENYKDEVIDYEDLFNGEYKAWLESLEPTHFDPATVHNVQLVHWSDGIVSYQPKNAPNFTGNNMGKEPFNRNRTFGYTTYQGNEYIVMPIEYWDPAHPDKNQWVITVNNITGKTDDYIQKVLKIWKNEMNVTTWVDSDMTFFMSAPDPLISKTIAEYPNLRDLVDNFADLGNNGPHVGDRSVLNLPGIVLMNYISEQSNPTYR